ncbi:MAG TPA: NifB/NifX family molybdenum-iron cluster-binding protein [Armatimonadota bacterium]|jgi:predicted Fe-Mo cluster-binding NifX family protein
MRNIAVACTADGRISDHFGRTTHFQVFTLENDEVHVITTQNVGGVTLQPGQGRHGVGHGGENGHHHGHDGILGAITGCEAALCGGMGQGIAATLTRNGITPVVVAGAYTPEEAVLAYVSGSLTTGAIHACCGHHHGSGEA